MSARSRISRSLAARLPTVAGEEAETEAEAEADLLTLATACATPPGERTVAEFLALVELALKHSSPTMREALLRTPVRDLPDACEAVAERLQALEGTEPPPGRSVVARTARGLSVSTKLPRSARIPGTRYRGEQLEVVGSPEEVEVKHTIYTPKRVTEEIEVYPSTMPPLAALASHLSSDEEGAEEAEALSGEEEEEEEGEEGGGAPACPLAAALTGSRCEGGSPLAARASFRRPSTAPFGGSLRAASLRSRLPDIPPPSPVYGPSRGTLPRSARSGGSLGRTFRALGLD